MVNAPRRLLGGPVDVALDLLVDAIDPASALRDPRVAQLEDSRREFNGAYRALLKTAPHVEHGVAVIRFDSPYQAHPLVAQTWARKLAPALVIAANDGYLAGKVNFSARGGHGDLRAALKAALPNENGEYGHGHDRATGGSLEPERFERMIGRLRESQRT